jgi:hypothetical protein
LNEQNSVRVKKALCQLCVALADHGYVDADGGEQVITFLVRNLVPHDDLNVSLSNLFILYSVNAAILFHHLYTVRA